MKVLRKFAGKTDNLNVAPERAKCVGRIAFDHVRSVLEVASLGVVIKGWDLSNDGTPTAIRVLDRIAGENYEIFF